jgi:hypothetical protein
MENGSFRAIFTKHLQTFILYRFNFTTPRIKDGKKKKASTLRYNFSHFLPMSGENKYGNIPDGLFNFFSVLSIKPRISHMLGMCSFTEVHP